MPQLPELNDLLSHAFSRAEATQIFWNFYAVVVTAIIGFLAAAKSPIAHRTIRYLLIGGFLVFAAANYIAIEDIRMQRE